MNKPDRPPDVSVPLDVCSEDALNKLRSIAAGKEPLSPGEQAAIVRHLCDVVATLSRTLELLIESIPGIATSSHISVEPDVEDDSAHVRRPK